MTYHIIAPDNLDQAGLDLLAAADGVSYAAFPKLARADLMAMGNQVDALIIRSATTVDAEMFEALPNLKAIARAGVGVDNVDLPSATQRGVVVMNTPDGNTIATTEHTFAMILALARHIPQAYLSMKNGKWDRKSFMGIELKGKTLGIFGFGRVGQQVAKRALAFDMTVIAYDPFIPAEGAQKLGVEMVDLDGLFAQSDYLTLHAIATPETKGIINTANIAKMKDGVRIVNVARGTLINDADLAAAIQAGKVAGAALDVFATEPPPADHLLLAGLDQVIHTPHLGASTEEAQIAVGVQATECVLAALLQGEYRNVVNPDVLKK